MRQYKLNYYSNNTVACASEIASIGSKDCLFYKNATFKNVVNKPIL